MTDYRQLVDIQEWDRSWQNQVGRHWQPLDYRPTHAQQRWIQYLMDHVPEKAKVLEIGCGGSQTLPFLARRKHAEVWGIDYSPVGVQSALAGLAAEQVEGKIILGDALRENELPKGYFDVVVSMGVIEHFPPPDNISVLATFATYACPSGILITSIPNIVGIIGILTRLLDNPLYRQHIPLDALALNQLHIGAGLEPISP